MFFVHRPLRSNVVTWADHVDDSNKRGAEGVRQKVTKRDSRQERLKLALRDNLKRRKSQARERDSQARGKVTEAPSNDHEEALDDEAGRDGGG
jgi:hypothetical protein